MNNIEFTPEGHAYKNLDNKKEQPGIGAAKDHFKELSHKESDKIPADVVKKEAHMDDTTAKISHVQALIRGWKSRNEVFLPHQILPFVQKHFIGFKPEVQEDIARVLCIEMNKVSTNPEIYHGKSVKLDEQLDAYLFAKPDESMRKLDRPFSLTIEMDRDGKNMRLLIVPVKIIGSGTFKEVYGAHDIEVQRSLEDDLRNASHIPSVGIKQKGKIDKGYAIQKEIIEKVKDGKFVNPAQPLATSDVKPVLDITYKEEWYNSDLQKAIRSGSIPVTFESNSDTVPFTIQQLMHVYLEVAKTVEAMAKEGYVHRDVKNPNILLKLEKGIPSAYLSDFDHAQKMGESKILNNYWYWDGLSKLGLVYPTTDAYGLVFSMAEAVTALLPLGYADKPYLILEESHFIALKNVTATGCAQNVLFSNPDPVFEPLRKSFILAHNAVTNTDEIAVRYSPQEIVQKVGEFLFQYGSSLSSSHEDFLRAFETQLFARTKIIDLFKELIEVNTTLYQLLVDNPELYQVWLEETQKNPDEHYKDTVLQSLPSPTYIREKIEAICNMF